MSHDEAIKFLKDVLEIELQNREIEKFTLLTEMMTKYLETIPFHNITIMSAPTKQVQSIEQVINCVTKKYGGICLDINTFFLLLLKALEYDAHLLMTSLFFDTSETESHSAILVQNLKNPGDKWIADFCHFPTFSPINLDFDVETPVYQEGYADYKYVKRGMFLLLRHRQIKMKLPYLHFKHPNILCTSDEGTR